ncbi:MAG: hypothetical protein AB1634_15845 [Thermodesulfobacteriota bacterium]
MTLEERTAARRLRMEVHRAQDFADAERWDLLYWQRQGAQARLSALVALHRDVARAMAARGQDSREEA